MQIYCRCSIRSARSPEMHPCCCCFFFGGGVSTNLQISFGADFVTCIKLGVLSLQDFKLGVLEPPKPPPRSYVSGKEVYIFFVDAYLLVCKI